MNKSKIRLLTFVSGNINGIDFTASGSGEADTDKGTTKAMLQYTRFPEDFTPLRCKSWKCVHHPAIAIEIEGGLNMYSITKGNYDLVQTIRYPDNQVIYASSQIRRIEPDTQIAISRFDGVCKGRVDVVKQMPYDEIISPSGTGAANFHGQRTIVFEDGEQMVIRWDGTFYFVDRNAVLPFDQVVHYESLVATRFSRSNLRYEKEMRVSISPRR